MSEPQRATFRSVGPAQGAPAWMASESVAVTAHVFARHVDPEAAAAAAAVVASAPVPEAAAPVREVAPEEEAVVVPRQSRPPSLVPPLPPRPASMPPASAALSDAARALLTARDEIVTDVQDELLALAIEIARAVIDTELDARPELHRRLVGAALDVLGPGVAPRVRVAPETFDAMIAGLGGRSFEVGGRRLELEIDPTLTGAGVVLEAGEARVDGTLEARLASVRAALARARHGATSEAA